MRKAVSRLICCLLFAAIALAVVIAPITGAQPPNQPEGSWSFAALGDSQNSPAIFAGLLRHIKIDPFKPEFLIHTGDLVDDGSQINQWVEYRKCLTILGNQFPVYPAVGNHDILNTNGPKNFIKFGQPPDAKTYYFFRYRDAGFICLFAYKRKYRERIYRKQMDWLKKTLDEMSSDVRVIFVFLHPPLLTREGFRHERPLQNSARLREVLRAGGVTAVFSGHEHIFDHRSEAGIHYFITGGGGAPLDGKGENSFHHYCRVIVSKDIVKVIAIDSRGRKRKEVLIK